MCTNLLLLCGIVSFFLFHLHFFDISADKYTTDTRKEKETNLDLFVWDSTIAMSDGEKWKQRFNYY